MWKAQDPDVPSLIVCEKCGRLFYEGHDELRDWLVSRWKTDPERWVIRCAPHISIWALRRAGLGRGKWVLKTVREMQERDSKRFVPEKPYVQPFPKMTESGDG